MGAATKRANGRAKQAAGVITGGRKFQREVKRDERVGSLKLRHARPETSPFGHLAQVSATKE